MGNNNNQSTTSCSSCHAPLPVDLRHRTCQAYREWVAASRRRRRAEDQQEAGVATRPRGRPRAKPAVYISQLSRLRPLVLGRMDKECPLATPCTESMKGKRHHLWVLLAGNHAASRDQSNCNSYLTPLNTWRTCLQVQTFKEGILRTTFVDRTLPLRLLP